MDMIRGIDVSLPRRMIVDGVLRMADALGIGFVAEGIETVAECETLRALGVRHQQGYLFARPGFRTLPVASRPARDLRVAA